jgi:sugar phosphate isomerase/epimerase
VTGAGRAGGDSVRQLMRSFVESMKPHVELAASLGITLAIENHANSLLDTPDSLRYFAEFADSPHLGVALAPYHLPQDAPLLAQLIQDLGDKLVHFYAWQHGKGCMIAQPKRDELLQMPGRGPLDFTPLLAALRKIGYAGWTEIFMHPYPRGIPILDTTEQVTAAINEARGYLEMCLNEA